MLSLRTWCRFAHLLSNSRQNSTPMSWWNTDLPGFEYESTLKRSPLYPWATRKMLPNKRHLQRTLENESQSQSSISLIPKLRWKDGTSGIKKIMGCTNDHVDMYLLNTRKWDFGEMVLELFQHIFAKFLLLFVALPHLVCPILPAILWARSLPEPDASKFMVSLSISLSQHLKGVILLINLDSTFSRSSSLFRVPPHFFSQTILVLLSTQIHNSFTQFPDSALENNQQSLVGHSSQKLDSFIPSFSRRGIFIPDLNIIVTIGDEQSTFKRTPFAFPPSSIRTCCSHRLV